MLLGHHRSRARGVGRRQSYPVTAIIHTCTYPATCANPSNASYQQRKQKTNQNGCRDRDDDATIHPPIRKKKRAQCTEYQLERKSVTMVKTAALPFIVFQQSITPCAPNETRCTHRCFGFTFQRLGASRASGLRGYDGNFLFFVFATGTAMESMVDTLKC